MSKNLIRIPLDQFAFLETEYEGTADMALVEYKRLQKAFLSVREASVGLPVSKWNPILVDYLNGRPLHPDNYHAMNEKQQFCISEIKKAFTRKGMIEVEVDYEDGPGKGENGDYSGMS